MKKAKYSDFFVQKNPPIQRYFNFSFFWILGSHRDFLWKLACGASLPMLLSQTKILISHAKKWKKKKMAKNNLKNLLGTQKNSKNNRRKNDIFCFFWSSNSQKQFSNQIIIIIFSFRFFFFWSSIPYRAVKCMGVVSRIRLPLEQGTYYFCQFHINVVFFGQMSIFQFFALLACRLAMRALIHPLEPGCLLQGGGRWVWRSAWFSTGVPVIRGIRGAGCPQGGWFSPKKMYELKLGGCHRFSKGMAEGSPKLLFLEEMCNLWFGMSGSILIQIS